MQSNALFPIKQVRSLDLLDGTTESPPEVPHKSRRTLMSPQECEIARCSRNQLEMTTNSPVLSSEQCPSPHHTGQLAWLPLGNSRDSLRHLTQVYRNTNFSMSMFPRPICQISSPLASAQHFTSPSPPQWLYSECLSKR